MAYQLTDRHLSTSMAVLSARDPDIAAAVAAFGVPASRRQPEGFASLLRIIVGQQLSTRAAATIFGRVVAALAEPEPSPERLLRLREPTLRKAGLSGAKVAYARALCSALVDGSLDLAALRGLDDGDVIDALTAVKGLGRWSAQMYLMFCLGRPDVWPSGDLGVRVGIQRIKGLSGPPSAAELDDLASPWTPHRSALSLLAWSVSNAPPVAG